MTSPDESRFDEELRRRLADFSATPPATDGWQALQDKLPAPSAKPSRGTRLRPFGAGVIVGALLWWGGSEWLPTETNKVTPAPAQGVAGPQQALSVPRPAATAPTAIQVSPTAIQVSPTAIRVLPTAISGLPTTIADPAGALALATTPNPAPTPTAPEGADTGGGTMLSPSVRQVVALDTAISRALRTSAAAPNERLRTLLSAQTQALAAAQHHLDSLKQALPEIPPALAETPDSTFSVPTPQPDWKTLPPVRSPWAMVALLETTPHWSVLPTAATAEQEQTQASLAQSLQLQRQLGTNWRVRGGLGQATLQTQGRYTSEKSGERTTTDSSTTATVLEVREHTSTITIVRIDSAVHYEPVLNGSGQVIGYDTVWVSKNDTVRSQIFSYDTTRTIKTVYTQRTETWRERHQQLLRPEYRFWTLPLSVQYLLVNRNRWSLGLSVGTQITVFRGGTRPVWNGDEYVLQRVGPRDGPYRPVSFSMSTGLEAQYRLTPRLSVLAAPTLRWWAVPATKARATTRTLLPAAQVGISYGF